MSKKDNKKYLSIPIEKFEIEEIDDDLAKVRVQVMHEGKNFNKSNFSIESLEDAETSIKNKPLLAVIEKDKYTGESDFKGHEIEYKIVRNKDGIDLETIYIEQPMGLIPETNNANYEIIDSNKWFVVDAYIWKEYCREAYDILKESNKKISMEIVVLESHTDEDGEYWIDKFKYTGITLLGDSYSPAMGENAEISLYTIEQKEFYTQIFTKISDGISNHLKILKESEVEEVSKKKDDSKAKFTKGVNQLSSAVEKALEKRTYMGKNYWDEPVEKKEFYLQDIIPDDSMIIVSSSKTWGEYYGISYTMDGDVVELDYDTMKRYVIGDWREMEGVSPDNNTQTFSKIKDDYDEQFKTFESDLVKKTIESFNVKDSEEYKALEKELNDEKEKFSKKKNEEDEKLDKEKYEKIEKELEELKKEKENFSLDSTELERLKKFESEKLAEERANQETVLFSEYKMLEDIEGFKELKNDCAKFSIDELKVNLNAMLGEAYKNNKFTVKEEKVEDKGTVKIQIDHKEEDNDPYGGLFIKHSTKK